MGGTDVGLQTRHSGEPLATQGARSLSVPLGTASESQGAQQEPLEGGVLGRSLGISRTEVVPTHVGEGGRRRPLSGAGGAGPGRGAPGGGSTIVGRSSDRRRLTEGVRVYGRGQRRKRGR